MADDSSLDYKSLSLKAGERRKQVENEGRQDKERNRRTTFMEFAVLLRWSACLRCSSDTAHNKRRSRLMPCFCIVFHPNFDTLFATQ
ncbi:yqcI protein [Penicillium lagena]|uniref:yqcI protein n=1 Tax=Penicillium lagena TaxID=94218 RepID=UPI002542296E|nr:yqcI protein [Penicillium lagena]KAJ5623845.1 yqcI protein [Penicillium lagena]